MWYGWRMFDERRARKADRFRASPRFPPRDKFETRWEEFHFAYIVCPDYGLQCDEADAIAYADDRTRHSPYRPDCVPPPHECP